MNKQIVRLLVVFVIVLLGSGLLVYVLLDRAGSVRRAASEPPAAATDQNRPAGSPEVATTQGGDRSILDQHMGPDVADKTRAEEGPWDVVAIRMFLRFLLAGLLAAGLAFRWRRG